MALKIITSLLILFVVFMGFKQGWAMLTGTPEMLTMFSKWHFKKIGVQVFGVVTLLSALLILFPKTFIWGNILMAATILLLICLQLFAKNTKGAVIEIPFLLLNLALLYLGYPWFNL